jgi:4-hydroxybenzoate polyprenyltransferase
MNSMTLIPAFLRLIRLANLVFIALTQFLFFYCIVDRLLEDGNEQFIQSRAFLFYLLVTASVLIAAAGYIINDYFDQYIDNINKPSKVVIDKQIKRRWAIFFHFLFSISGLLISIYVGYKINNWLIPACNLFCILLLWFYSTTFKKKLLSGNIIISALTSWVILVIYFFVGAGILHGWESKPYPFDIRKLYKITMLYAGFAFVISLVREVVKDMEDMEGDVQYNCRTIPVVWGIPGAKIFSAVWLTVLMSALGVVAFYALQSGWWLAAGYCVLLILIPLLKILQLIYRAKSGADYHTISNGIKIVMFTGILSMIFFKFIS